MFCIKKPNCSVRQVDFWSWFLLPFYALIVAPLTTIYKFVDDFVMPAPMIYYAVTLVGICIIVIITIIIWCISHKKKLIDNITSLMVAVYWGVWCEYNLLKFDKSILDGGNNSAALSHFAYQDIFAFITIVLLVFAAITKFRDALTKIIILSYLVAFASLGLNIIEAPRIPNIVSESSDQDVYALSKDKNIFLLVLDATDSDAFDEYVNDNNRNSFSGFKKFDDTISVYRSTGASVPSYLTGKINKNDEPLSKLYKKYSEFNILNNFGKSGFAVSAITNGIGLENIGTKYLPMSFAAGYAAHELIKIAETSLYLMVPVIIKKYLYSDGHWLLSHQFYSVDGLQDFDKMYVNAFEKNSNPTLDVPKLFYIHFRGSHVPIAYNDQLEYIGNIGVSQTSYNSQAAGSIKNIERLLERLKVLGVYNNSKIIIMGDHGSGHFVPKKTIELLNRDFYSNVESRNPDVNGSIFAASHPLFMVKDFNASGKLKRSNKFVSLLELPCYVEEIDFSKCSNGNIRYFFNYEWDHSYWLKDSLPPLTEYKIVGNSYLPENWESNEVRGQVDEKNVKSVRRKLKIINFGIGDDLDRYDAAGFWGQENSYRWGSGYVSYIKFWLDEVPKSSMVINVNMELPYLKSLQGRSEVKLYVNDAYIQTLKHADTNDYKIIMEASIFKEGNNKIAFKTKDVLNPYLESDGVNQDKRNLSFMIRKLSVEKNDSK